MFDFPKRLKMNFEEKREQRRLEEEGRAEAREEQERRERLKREKERREHEELKQKQRVDAKKRKCPYCSAIIDQEPKGKFKCLSCKSEIHIQKSGKEIKLLTKDERERINAERKERAAENRYFNFFQDLNVQRSYLEQRRNDWFRQMGEKANYPDLTWSLSHELLQRFGKSKKYFEMKMLYLQMALMQKQEGKEFFHLLQEARKMELYDIRKQMSGFNDDMFKIKYKVVIIGGESDCLVCSALNNKKFTIEEVFETMPLPAKNCTHDGGWCTCCYAIEAE